MDLSKSYEFFQPEKNAKMIHIVGCGSVGSTLAENLVRCGIKDITLWDFDYVEKHNIVNQLYREEDVGKLKVEALKNILVGINKELKDTIKVKPDGWQDEIMSGFIFLAVDNIELRKKIVEAHMTSVYVKAVFDFRTLLESAQHYAADWSSYSMRKDLLNSMQFTHDEATEETPTSACGTTLGVATTVRLICALGVNNYINFMKGGGLKKMIIIDGFNFTLDAF